MIANEQTLQEEYNAYVILNRIQDNRQHHNVMARFAFMVAARDIYNTLQIARVTKKNHATVIHAWRNHQTNLKFDRQYLRNYNYCVDIVNKIREEGSTSEEITLRNENAKLLERLQNVREDLQETQNRLYIVQEELNAMKENELCT